MNSIENRKVVSVEEIVKKNHHMKGGWGLVEWMVVTILAAIAALVIVVNSKGSVDDAEISSLWQESHNLIERHRSVANTLGTYANLDAAEHINQGYISNEIVDAATAYTVNGVATNGRIASAVKKGCYHHFAGAADGVSFAYEINCDAVSGWSAGAADGNNQANKNRLASLYENNMIKYYGIETTNVTTDKTDGKLIVTIDSLN